MPGCSRRVFLKTGLFGFSSLALSQMPFGPAVSAQGIEARKYVSLFTGRIQQGTATACGLCPAGCGLLAFVRRGELLGLTGNPEHPYNQGSLCALGSAAFDLFSHPQRILKPLKRKGARGEGKWQEISWQEALAEVTQGLKAVQQGKVPGSLAISAPEKEISPFLLRFLDVFDQGVLNEADGYERALERAGHQVFGFGEDGVADIENAQVVLNFGANPLGSIRQIPDVGRQWALGLDKGVHWVTLDPRLSETAAASQEWIPLRPGTDGVLALALAQVILKNGWEDRSSLEQMTDVEIDQLSEALSVWTPERASDICQISARRIRRLAERLARADRAVALFGSGVTARKGGLEIAQSVLMLNYLTGNINQKGGYQMFRPTRWEQPGLSAIQGDRPVLPGTLFGEIQKGKRDVGCLFSCHANSAATDPDCSKTQQILKDQGKIPFHIAMVSRWNETAQLADLVLPATTCLESWGLNEQFTEADGLPWISLRQPVLPAAGQARAVEDVLLEVVNLLNGDMKNSFNFKDVGAYYHRLINKNASAPDIMDPFAVLKEKGFIKLKRRQKDEGAIESDRPVEQRYKLNEVVAKIVPLIFQSVRERSADTKGKNLLLYTSPLQGDDTPACKWLEEIAHADPVWMHPAAAAELGCKEGDWVSLKGPAGEIETRVRLSEGIHPEAVAMRAGARDRNTDSGLIDEVDEKGRNDVSLVWWTDEIYGENARKVISWPENPGQEAPGWMDTRVTIKRLDRVEHKKG